MPLRPLHHRITRGHRSIRRLGLTAAMLTSLAATFAAPPSTLAEDCANEHGLEIHAGLSQNHRSIVLIEGRDPAHVETANGLVIHTDLSQSHRSIVQIEGEDPANLPAATTSHGDLAIHADLSPSHRSIVQAEAEDPANVPSTALAC